MPPLSSNMRPVRRRSRGTHEADIQPSPALLKAPEPAGELPARTAETFAESWDTPAADASEPDAS